MSDDDDRLTAAIRRMGATKAALDEYTQTVSTSVPGEFEELIGDDRSARIEYAAALLARGWSVPHALLHDVPEVGWPAGYQQYS